VLADHAVFRTPLLHTLRVTFPLRSSALLVSGERPSGRLADEGAPRTQKLPPGRPTNSTYARTGQVWIRGACRQQRSAADQPERRDYSERLLRAVGGRWCGGVRRSGRGVDRLYELRRLDDHGVGVEDVESAGAIEEVPERWWDAAEDEVDVVLA